MEVYRQSAYERAKRKVADLKKFYRSIFIFLIVFAAVAFAKFYRTGEVFSNGISIIFVFWGMLLALKGGKLLFFNSDWEEDMIKKELKNQQNGNQ